jgi:hypothetical protein
MKRILFITVAILCLLAVSCKNTPRKSGQKTYQEAEQEFRASLTAADTTIVLGMTDSIMALVQDGYYHDAVKDIKVLEGTTLYEPSERYLDELERRFEMFKPIRILRDYYSFSTAGVNDVKYRICFREESEGHPASFIAVTFNPVKIDGKWYLAFKDGYQSSDAMSDENKVNPNAPAPERTVFMSLD